MVPFGVFFSNEITPIMVMNPSEESFATMVSYDLEPEIYSIHVLQEFIAILQREGIFYGLNKIHLKIDTGMNRLGFQASEIADVIQLLKKNKGIQVASAFTHLAASDTSAHDAFTHHQVEQFTDMSQRLEAALGYPIIKHVLNSAGIERFPNYQFDMVRLGIGVYGISSVVAGATYLQPVASLTSIIAQIKKVSEGETIGYSRAYTAPTDMTIAIVPLGYADGLDRRLSNGVGAMYVNGKKCPIVGNICMDLTMIDVTQVTVSENDRVEIFGKHITVNEIAQQMHTIPYEIIATVPARVKRLYLKEDS